MRKVLILKDGVPDYGTGCRKECAQGGDAGIWLNVNRDLRAGCDAFSGAGAQRLTGAAERDDAATALPAKPGKSRLR